MSYKKQPCCIKLKEKIDLSKFLAYNVFNTFLKKTLPF